MSKDRYDETFAGKDERFVAKPSSHDEFKKILKHYKRVGYDTLHAWLKTQSWFIAKFFNLHDGGSDLRLNDDTDIKRSSAGQCLLLSMAGSTVAQLGFFLKL